MVVVRFGDPKMGINRDDPKKRASLEQDTIVQTQAKWKARYWSCYQWRAGAKVDN